MYKNKNNPAFTIVELLIVIVIIGVLAAITIVSYTGITKKANESTTQADLANAKKQIELYKVIHGQYPTGLDQSTGCLTGNIAPSPDTNYCLKKSNSTATYTMSNADGTIYTLKLDNGTLAYKITESTGPTSTTTTPIAESFVKTWGGSGNEEGYSPIQASDGGYVITGQTSSFGAGSLDAFIAKYDNSGNIVWNKTWGGVGDDCGRSLIQSIDGGYVVTGRSSSFGAGGSDVFINKYDASGNIVWSKTWGGTGYEVGIDIVNAGDGGYVITGYTASYGAGGNDMFIAKYDGSGVLIWNKVWGGSGDDIGYGLVKANDGGYAVAGYTSSYGVGSVDAFLAKFDSSANVTWVRTWGGASAEYAHCVIQTNDGGFAINGYTASYGAGSTDMFLVKYDNSGNLAWNKVWGGGNSEIGEELVQNSSGDYIILGWTVSYGAGAADIFLSKYDTSGNYGWGKTFGGVFDDIGYDVLITPDGGYVIAGATDNYGIGRDSLLIKYNSVVNIVGCVSPMCQTPTATIATPSATVTSPTATVTSPTATITTPSATITAPTATQTTVVAVP